VRKTVQVLAITALLAGATQSAGAASQPGPGWGACPTGPGVVLDPRQECATIQVPLDYGDPTGEQLGLAISRISTATPQARRGVLLLIPGGPGNSGLSRPSTYGLRLPKQVLDRYDIVGFDPRGVGRSTPVSCGLGPADLDPLALLPWPAPGGDISGNTERARRIALGCLRQGGSVLRHISTRNEARDIDQIRRALGEPRLSYWAVSYGTYVGAVYATMFPDRTDRVVLDSSDDPDPDQVARGWAANFAAGAEDRFPDFARWAADRDSTYGLGVTPTAVRHTYLRLAAALDQRPRPDLSGNTLRAVMFNSLYSDATFPQLAQVLRAAATSSPPPDIPLPPAEQLQNYIAAQTATACNDVTWPRSVSDYARAVARDRAAHPLTAGMPVNIFACAFWPLRPTEPATRISDRGPSNVLMIQNLRDPATPHSAALKMRRALGQRARMVTVDSGGHGAYLANGNSCGDHTVTAFLTTGERPHHDTTCRS
jgi:pimeloyl-ACP methyl ester carboxylesterase